MKKNEDKSELFSDFIAYTDKGAELVLIRRPVIVIKVKEDSNPEKCYKFLMQQGNSERLVYGCFRA